MGRLGSRHPYVCASHTKSPRPQRLPRLPQPARMPSASDPVSARVAFYQIRPPADLRSLHKILFPQSSCSLPGTKAAPLRAVRKMCNSFGPMTLTWAAVRPFPAGRMCASCASISSSPARAAEKPKVPSSSAASAWASSVSFPARCTSTALFSARLSRAALQRSLSAPPSSVEKWSPSYTVAPP